MLLMLSALATTGTAHGAAVFEVTAEEKDQTHPFHGVGHDVGFVVNGEQGKRLIAVRGESYAFEVDTGVQHDFYLSTSDTGWGAAAFTNGVSGQFTFRGTVTFTPGDDTPGLLFYQCRNHRNMGAAIYVVDEDEQHMSLAELEAERGGGTPAAAGERSAAETVSEAQARQRIQFADMLINQSSAANRVKGSGDTAALELYESARTQLAASREAVSAGRTDEAMSLADEAMSLMNESAALVPEDARPSEAQRTRFEEMYEGIQTFQSSYARNHERMAESRRDDVPKVNMDEIRATRERARSLADDGQYGEAIALLSEAQAVLTTALAEMLDEEMLSYELVFETPREEYEYELSRYHSFQDLVPLAIEQRRPSEQAKALMMTFVDRAKEIKELSGPEAEQGNYEEAILMLQGAISHIQRALQTVGVR